MVDTIDEHGQSYDKYSVVVYGRYYAQVPHHGKGLIFVQYKREKEAIMYSHLVIAVKLKLERIQIKKKTLAWKLPNVDNEGILEILMHRKDSI